MRVGVIADTHGKLLPEVHDAFAGVSLIFHAGDIGDGTVIAELETIARVVAIRGNVDADLDPPAFPDTRRLTLEGVDIFLCHQPDRAALLTPPPTVVIHGHTHRARNERLGATLWFNPGTAGKPKVAGEYTVGILTLSGGTLEGEIVQLR
ncbi:MAG TPA: metallophosphoesterase family protein [Armatimonadota bacterium]